MTALPGRINPLNHLLAAMSEQYKNLLKRYIPAASVDHVFDYIIKNKIFLRINQKRLTKLGDYRPPNNTKPARISINYDLNNFEFLIILIHEMAHHEAFTLYGHGHKPHGQEWKDCYSDLMKVYLNEEVFPKDILQALEAYLFTYNLSPGSEAALKKVLRTYDPPSNTTVVELYSLPAGAHFSIPNGRTFQKLEKRRTRYVCLCMRTKRKYLVHGMTQVIPFEV
ncbi:MAG: SprT-like domain-containing protein [Bacteroidales bacterium]